jgi:dTDP-D-glucose 4,6-dehydratase
MTDLDRYADRTVFVTGASRLGWTPALTLDAGLERTVPWYREALA